MPDDRDQNTTSSSSSIEGQIDRACDRFEAAWKSGQQPRLESHLESLPEAARERAFRELLELELAYRRRGGQAMTADAYQNRFPVYGSAIREAFSTSGEQSDRASQPAERNLLFGILALQMDFVSREQLIAAMNAWVLEKKTPLGEILRRGQVLGAEEMELLNALVAKHLSRHGNDPEKSLAAVSSIESFREQLHQLGDPEVEATLALVAKVSDHIDPVSTLPFSMGESTSTGQRFRILRPHAKGGLGEVFVAQDEELGREVALKRIQDRHADNPSSRSRFLLEAEITGGLEHPGIVPVYGLGTYADGRPYYAMRFIRGDSLKRAIEWFHAGRTSVDPSSGANEGTSSAGDATGKLQGRASPFASLAFRKLLGRFIDVCNAIEYAHSRGILHRDLKPGNIMVGKYGETLVVDWGLAKAIGRPEIAAASGEVTLKPSSGSGSAPTQMGSAIGTPQFMSPEQAAGRHDLLGPESDVYSLGATLYCLLTGKAPLADQDSEDLGEILRRVKHGEITPPRDLNRDVPKPLEAICQKAMAVKPASRYSSPRALADDLEHWLADEPIAAQVDTPAQRFARWSRRHRAVVRAAAAAILLVAIVSSIATFLVNRARQAADQLAVDNFDLARKQSEANTKLQSQAVELNRQLAHNLYERANGQLAQGKLEQGIAYLEAAYEKTPEADQLRRSIANVMGGWAELAPICLPNLAEVSTAWFSPDGSTVFTGCADGSARLWDSATGRPIGEPMRHDGPIRVSVFSRDGRTLLTGSDDKSARLWDARTGKPIGEPMKHDDKVYSVAIDPSGSTIVTASFDWTTHRWDARTGKPLNDAIVRRIQVFGSSPDGALFVTANPFAVVGSPTAARLWETRTGKPVGEPMKCDDQVKAVSFNPNGLKLLIGSRDGFVRLWDTRTCKPIGKPVGERVKHEPFYDWPVDAVSNPDGSTILTAGTDSAARLWNARTGEPQGAQLKLNDRILSMNFSPDGSSVLTASSDGSVRLWDAQAGKPIGEPMMHENGVLSAVYSSDGSMVLTRSQDHIARLWNARTAKPIARQMRHGDYFAVDGFSPDGSRVLTRSGASAYIWDLRVGMPLGEPIARFPFPGRPAVAYSHDGSVIAIGGHEEPYWRYVDNQAEKNVLVRLCDAHTGKPFGAPFESRGDEYPRLAFSFDDSVVFTTRQFWNTRTRRPVFDSAIVGPFSPSAVSPDGATFLTVRDEYVEKSGWARLWDARTGNAIGEPFNHGNEITAIAFSPDGSQLVIGCEATARLWDARTGKPLGEPMKQHSDISAVAYSPDGATIVVMSDAARLWDARTGKPLGEPMKHESATLVAYSPNGSTILTGSSSDTGAKNAVRLWDARTGKPIGEAMTNDLEISKCYDRKGSTLLTRQTDDEKMIWSSQLWNARTGKPIGEPMKHDGAFEVVRSPDDSTILTWTDHVARLWDARNGKPIGDSMKHDDFIRSAAFSPNSSEVLTGSGKEYSFMGGGAFNTDEASNRARVIAPEALAGIARIWDARTGKLIAEPMKHPDAVTFVAYSPDGSNLLTVSSNIAQLWNASTAKPIGESMTHDGAILEAAFSPKGTTILTGSADRTARLWNGRTGKPVGEPMEHQNEVNFAEYSPDGSTVLTGTTIQRFGFGGGGAFQIACTANSFRETISEKKVVRLWDAKTGKPIGAPIEHGNRTLSPCYTPNGGAVFTTTYDEGKLIGTAQLWDTRKGEAKPETIKHDGKIQAIAFSPDGTNVVTASDDGTARLWNAKNGKSVGQPMKHDAAVVAVAYNPNGSTLVTGSADKSARLWNARTGIAIGLPMNHQAPVDTLVVSPNGDYVLTASADKTARLWDARTGMPLGEPMVHDARIEEAHFSADGSTVYTKGAGTIKMWDARTNRPVAAIVSLDLTSSAFSPDGTTLLAGLYDGTVRRWLLPRPIPDEFVRLVAAQRAGVRLGDFGKMNRMTDEQLVALWKQAESSGADQLSAIAKADERRTAGWHHYEASETEASKNWFAAEFHLKWISAHEPPNADLASRLDRARRKRLNMPLQFMKWGYTADNNGVAGCFTKESSDWVESKSDKSAKYTFKETARTAEYVELFDSSRKIWVRLGDSESFVSTNQKQWNALYKGNAAESISPPTSPTPEK